MRRAVTVFATVAALVVAAWFGLGMHQAVDQDHAESLIAAHPHLTAAQARQASALLDSAGTLNPDRQIDLDRSSVALGRGQTLNARRRARSVTDAEPENLDAWVALARSSSGDPQLFRDALKRVAALEPIRPN
jgi:protein-tyrosine-phosphatase